MNFFQSVYEVTKKIPRGKVATYGQIAALIGKPRAARTVGWALHELPEAELRTIPWHRVINHEGRVSTTCRDHPAAEQALFLRREKIGVKLKNGNYWIDLKKYLWKVQL
ncbi:MAG: methylated-DNA--[protein]-cysteine S-methyltransferase [Candidatus Doudnabacteria bacterium]|nr:methylated-DNA--[protein]-cysteine S-methyltransferase [Candidatus Doudnabacteria bacterium]